MKVYKGSDEIVTRVAPAGGVTSGVPVVIGAEFLVPQASAAVGVKFAAVKRGRVKLDSDAADTFTQGAKAYWNPTDEEVEDTDSALNYLIGTVEAAASSNEVIVCLNGNSLASIDGDLANKVDKVTGATGELPIFTAGGGLESSAIDPTAYPGSSVDPNEDGLTDLQTFYQEAKALANEMRTDLMGLYDAVTLQMTDDDNAATTGKALYISLSHTFLGDFNCDNSGGNADSFVELSDGSYIRVWDNDASGAGAAEGTAVFYDETNDVLTSALTHGKDVYVPTSDGRLIKVAYNADPGAAGHIAVYFDDNGGTATARVLFVATDNANATAALDTAKGLAFDRAAVTAGAIT